MEGLIFIIFWFSVTFEFSGPVKPFVNSRLFYAFVNFEEKINAFMQTWNRFESSDTMYAKFLFHGLTSYNLICSISLLSVVYLQSFILLAKTGSRNRANS